MQKTKFVFTASSFKRKCLQGLLLLNLIALLIACNNHTKKSESEQKKDSTTVSLIDTSAPVVRAFKLHTYILTAKQQMGLLSEDVMELKLTFKRLKADVPDDYTLDVVGANGEKLPDGDIEIGSAVDVLLKPNSDTTFQSGIKHMQRLTRGSLRTLYGVSQSTRLEAIPFVDLYLTPILNAQKMVIFSVTKVGTKASGQIHTNTKDEIFSNPSPPAHPCDMEGSCDSN